MKIKTDEIRIGNYVECNGKIEKVTGVIQYGVYFDFGYCPNVKDLIRTIKLNEEWLIEFGFERTSIKMSGCNVWQKGKYRILKSYVEPENEYSLCIDGITPASCAITRFSYIHQLQNIYFMLEGNEMKKNPR